MRINTPPGHIASYHPHVRIRVCESIIRQVKRGTILDAGCGSGAYVSQFRDSIDDLVCLDLFPDFLHRIHNGRGIGRKVHLVVGDVTHLPFRDRSFDFVLCAEVIEHIPEPLCFGAVSELFRAARGKILVTTPNMSLMFRILRMIVAQNRHVGRREVAKELHEVNPLAHNSLWTSGMLREFGFEVHGCFGMHIRLTELLNRLTWGHPSLAGTLLATVGLEHVDAKPVEGTLFPRLP